MTARCASPAPAARRLLAPHAARCSIKEFMQLRRDRISFAHDHHDPADAARAVRLRHQHHAARICRPPCCCRRTSDVGRSILAALENTAYFKRHAHRPQTRPSSTALLASGEVLFAIEIPANFERALRRGDRPALLVAADATDPVAAGSALGALSSSCRPRCATTAPSPTSAAPPFEIRTHARYNPAAVDQLNIVPGLLGTILTMTMLIFTALSVTREIERGTMESLLSMPITPVEIMLGKIVPYIIVGFVQAALIIGIGIVLFDVPILGSLALLALLSTLFIATNLSVGYTFSTIAQNQLQAMQMSMMFFLPNILLSGFMFPFAGMPGWAQWIGECAAADALSSASCAAIMLKGANLSDLHYDTLALAGLMLIAMTIAVTRFRRTLD